MSYAGRSALVTGAASGIGAAIVAALLEAGARVTACDVDETGLAELAGRLDGELSTTVCDVGDDEQARAAVAGHAERYGGLDVLFNNAGIMDDYAPVAELDDEQYRRVMHVNVDGAMRMARAAVNVMIGAGGGAIVNTASAAALRGGRAGAAYTISKHATVGLTRSIAFMHAADGIRCNALCPGNTDTGLGWRMRSNKRGLEALKPVFSTVPDATTPQRMAGVALFLGSEEAGDVTGEILLADRGWLVA
jgi:NAD(P)-dependent dehydrogenase (short-subunit alcohol dehydrogenase family)